MTLFNNGELAILLGNGDGTFKTGASYMIEPGELLTADLNGDGNLDLVIYFLPTSQTLTLLGNGDGTFRPPLISHFMTGPTVIGDFNRDGKLDLATLGSLGAAIALGNGDGTFQAPELYFDIPLGTGALAAGDFNKDGKPDIAASGNSISILTNRTK